MSTNTTCQSGVVDWYKADKGFGNIITSDGIKVFVHSSGIVGTGYRYLAKGEPVEFKIKFNEAKKRKEAFSVRPAPDRVDGSVDEFSHEKGFGFIRPDTGGDRLFFHHSNILWNGGGRSSAKSGDRVQYEVGSKDGQPVAVRVKPSDPRPPLQRFAWMGLDDDWLPKLAEKCETEDWKGSGETGAGDYPILKSYIMHTFARLEEEDSSEDTAGTKIAVGENEGLTYSCFNTGLVTVNQEQVYALFTGKKPDSGRRQQRLNGFYAESDQKLLGLFHKLPELANYFDDPSVLLYDRRCELYMDIDHIIDERLDRFPAELRTNKFLARQALDAARRQTEQRVYRNYKTAIPQFHRGKVQLLLPICLMQPSRADLALVVTRKGQQYLGSTTLTLDMAYSNARLLCRPDTEWLQP